MRVFVTGATGYIGSALVKELIRAGHVVVGLARSDRAEAALRRVGAIVHLGSLTDLDSLRKGASTADGVIHLAYMHGLGQIPLRERLGIFLGGGPAGIVSRFVGVTTRADKRAIDAIGETLSGSGRPMVTTFGTMGLAVPGHIRAAPATERDHPDPRSPGFGRARVERAVQAWAERGVRASVIRLPPTVYGPGNAGFVSELIKIAGKKAVSAFPGDGENRWPAVHRNDAARLFRLALEDGSPGACYHGVAEEGIPVRSIAGAISQMLDVPHRSIPSERVAGHFGWLAPFVSIDNASSAQQTTAALNWHPSNAGLLEEIVQGL